MIKVENLSRIYNKGKRNEIRACDNISIELESKGFYVIFGKSGAGKSSFMNALGGLDNFNEGTITYDDETYKHIVSDKCRVANIGYIFQNYCLDANTNVYENVALGLKSVGVTDKEVIFNRVMTALANVDMTKYYRRNVTTLSGGQQQRVAIARAMAKGSKIILADEPTGNLDVENTRIVMNILKELSKTRMVIVVTHEVDIVEKYADKIIEIHDGKIVDTKDGTAMEYEHHEDNIIYLKDLESTQSEFGELTIEQYGKAKKINIKVVSYEGKTYLQTDDPNIKIVDKNSEVKLINSTKEQAKSKEKEDLSVKLKELDEITPKNYGKVFRFKDCIGKPSRTESKKTKKRNKFLKVSLTLLLIVIICISAAWGAIYRRIELNTKDRNGNFIQVQVKNTILNANIDNFIETHKDEIEEVSIFIDPNIADFNYDDLSINMVDNFDKVLSLNGIGFESNVGKDGEALRFSKNYYSDSINKIKDKTLKYGKMPTNDKEIVVSTGIFKSYVEGVQKNFQPQFKPDLDDLMIKALNSEIVIGNRSAGKKYILSGIYEEEDAVAYLSPGDVLTDAIPIRNLTLGVDSYITTVNSGDQRKVAIAEYDETTNRAKEEVITFEDDVIYVKRDYINSSDVSTTATIKVNGVDKTYKVMYVGATLDELSKNDLNAKNGFYATNKTLDELGYKFLLINSNNLAFSNYVLNIRVKDEHKIDKLTNEIKEFVSSSNDTNLEYFANSKDIKNVVSYFDQQVLKGMGITELVLLGFILIITFLVIFANFMENTKEVGIYRAIGVSKSNIVFKYFVENLRTVILNVTLVILIFGIILCLLSYFPIAPTNPFLNGSMMFLYWWQLLGIIAIVIPIIMLISIIPPLNYVRKSTIKILSEYDM